MVRKIIQIDEEKCIGCGACVNACHEGAIAMVNGKARLVRDDYCDGLGACLPACPTDAISFVEREAAAFDEKAATEAKAKAAPVAHGCPGSQTRTFTRAATLGAATLGAATLGAAAQPGPAESELRQWPVQIKLVPVKAAFFDNAQLLIAADCSAFAYGNFHRDFIKNHLTLIGCPKLDDGDYSEKLTEIIRQNTIKSVTIVRMEVPCCGGLERAAIKAMQQSGKFLPWQVITISTQGEIV